LAFLPSEGKLDVMDKEWDCVIVGAAPPG